MARRLKHRLELAEGRVGLLPEVEQREGPGPFTETVLNRPGNRDRVVALEERAGRSVGEMDVAAMLRDPEARSLVAGLSRPDKRRIEGGSE